MKTAVIAMFAVLFAVLFAASLAAQMRGPTYDPVEDARQRAEVAQIEALQTLQTAVAAFWRVLPATLATLATIYATALGAAHIRRYRTERNPNRDGVLPVLAIDQDSARIALLGYHQARIEDARRAMVPHSLSYAPHTIHQRSDAPVLPGDTAQPELPGPCDLATLAFRPTRDSILLGLGAGGDLVTVPAKALCHVALVGATGAGKSNLLRMLLPQLQSIGATTYLCDPHFARSDANSGESWAAIEQRLATSPAHEAADMSAMFSLFTHELSQRLQRRRDGQIVGKSMFLCLDELPVIADKVSGSMTMLASLLREGRKVGMYVVGASQSMLVKVIGSDSAARDCYRTSFYVGGDLHSASALLDMPRKDIDESALTTGVAMLRSTATSPARLVRVPYASNAAIDAILTGTATVATVATEQAHEQAIDTSGSHTFSAAESATVALGRPATHTAQEARILALFGSGKSLHEVASDVSGTTNPNARAYREARVAVEAVLRSIVSV